MKTTDVEIHTQKAYFHPQQVGVFFSTEEIVWQRAMKYLFIDNL